MTSEKSYSTEQRLNALIAALGPLATFVPDASWTDTGSMTNSWSKASGFFKYKLLLPGVVAVCAQALTPGTVSDGTLIVSAANGLGSGYRPSTNKSIVADTNFLKTAPVGTGSFENARLTFVSDGSVTCNGFGLSATYCNLSGLIFTDI